MNFFSSYDDKFEAMKKRNEMENQDTLDTIPAERWLEEFRKLALSPKPSTGLNLAWDLGIFEKHFPMFKDFKTNQENQIHHPEGDTWTHTMMVVDEIANYGKNAAVTFDGDRFLLFLAGLCHDLGKPEVNELGEDGIWTQRNHSEAGVEPTLQFLTKINVDLLSREKILNLVREHLAPAILTTSAKDRPMRGLRRLAVRLHPATMDELFPLAICDMQGRGTTEEKKVAKAHELYKLWNLADVAQIANKKPEPVLSGKDLISVGFKPGVEMGKMIVFMNNLHEEHDLTKEQILDLFAKKNS